MANFSLFFFVPFNNFFLGDQNGGGRIDGVRYLLATIAINRTVFNLFPNQPRNGMLESIFGFFYHPPPYHHHPMISIY